MGIPPRPKRSGYPARILMKLKDTKIETEEKIVEAIYGTKPYKTGAFAVLIETPRRQNEKKLNKYAYQRTVITEEAIPCTKELDLKKTLKEIIAYISWKYNYSPPYIIVIQKNSEDPYIHYFKVNSRYKIEELKEFKNEAIF